MAPLVAHLAFAFSLLPVLARHLVRQDSNNGIHLAVSPICGLLSGNSTDANAGVDLRAVKTIVSFGVSHDFVRVHTQVFRDGGV